MTLFTAIVLVTAAHTGVKPAAGFYLPPPHQEVSVSFEHVENLPVLSVTINDSIRVNLILDTGCRNLVLFGKDFMQSLSIKTGRQVQFSGLGAGKPVIGSLSIGNSISIGNLLGINMPVVIVPDKNLFTRFNNKIDGVIGYDLFSRFEIEINPKNMRITFRDPDQLPRTDFTLIPIEIKDCKPLVVSFVELDNNHYQIEILLDTGSSLELLLSTSDVPRLPAGRRRNIGIGLNGAITGIQSQASKLSLQELDIYKVNASIIVSQWRNYASLGMAVLKDYILVMNYLRGTVHVKAI